MTGFIVSATLLIVVFLGGYLVICYRQPAMLLAAILIYSMLTKMVSVMFLDTFPLLIIETNVTSGNIGATWRFLVYNLLILGGFLLAVRPAIGASLDDLRQWPAREISRRALSDPASLKLAVGVCVVALLSHYVNIALSPRLPLPGSGVTRFTYWLYYQGFPPASILFGVLAIFVPFVSGTWLAHLQSSGASAQAVRAPLFMIFAYAGFLFITGQKFNGLVLSMLPFIPYMILRRANGQSLMSRPITIMLISGVTLAFAIGAADIASRNLAASLGGDGLATVLYRVLVLQGGVYYTLDRYAYQGGTMPDLELVTGGMDVLLTRFGNNNLALNYIEAGVNLAGALPGALAATFGFWWAGFFCLLFGIFAGVFNGILYRLIFLGRLVGIIPASYVWVNINAVFARGSFEPMLSPVPLFMLVVTLYMYFSLPRRLGPATRFPAHKAS